MAVNTPNAADTGETQVEQPQSVARSAGTVGLFTMVSRFGGLFRDAVFANLFGAGTASDAYLMAFTIPNTFRTLVAEGSLTVAFLPVFREAEKTEGPSAGRRLLAEALVIFPGFAALLAGLAILGAEPLVRLFASGFQEIPGKFELTVRLTRIMFAYLPLVSAVALAMGALNARRHFATSAAAPALFNLTVIAGLFLTGALNPDLGAADAQSKAIVFVAWAVVAGGASQILLQLYGLRRAGLSTWPAPQLSLRVRRIGALMLPAVGALAVYQLNILIVRNLASSLPEGAVTSLFYADRFFQLPLGVFGIAIATASLPALADAHLEGGAAALLKTLRRSLELNAWIAVPATVGLMVLALPVCATVLQHGAFSHDQAIATSRVLSYLAPGLLAVASLRVLSQAFFSIQDTRTPVACSALGVSVNVTLAPWLAGEMGAAGLACSLTASAWLQLAAQLLFLRVRLRIPIGLLSSSGRVVRPILASIPMALVAYAIAELGRWSDGLTARNGAVLLVAVSLGGVSYGLAQGLTGDRDVRRIAAGISRRVSRR